MATCALSDDERESTRSRSAVGTWDHAAARLDRHHNAYGTPGQPTALERATGYPYTAQAVSAADTRRAIDQLTHTLHPVHDRDLGIGL